MWQVASLVVVHVPDIGALDSVKDDGLPSHGIECAHWAVHASWQESLGLCEDL